METTENNPSVDAPVENLKPALYLLPVSISDNDPRYAIPDVNFSIMRSLKYYIVENVRTARRFLKRCSKDIDIASITFFELNRHTDPNEISSFLAPLRKGEAVGVMSEAGCPAVADPGAAVVDIAQRENLKVVPLIGPSSILLSLMGSGFNGQGFSFHGYLPIERNARAKAIKRLEADSAKFDMTQIFIETPYRNGQMLSTLTDILQPDTKVCVACDITDPEKEFIVSRTVSAWKKNIPDIDKRPAIFLIYRKNSF